MRRTITAAIAAVSLIGGLAAAGEASADRRHRHNDDAAAAAIAGFALGAIVGGDGRYYGGHPGPRYSYGYGHRYYGPAHRHYRPDYGYYRPNYGYGYGYHRPYHRRCWTVRDWDPYWGRVDRRVCR